MHNNFASHYDIADLEADFGGRAAPMKARVAKLAEKCARRDQSAAEVRPKRHNGEIVWA